MSDWEDYGYSYSDTSGSFYSDLEIDDYFKNLEKRMERKKVQKEEAKPATVPKTRREVMLEHASRKIFHIGTFEAGTNRLLSQSNRFKGKDLLTEIEKYGIDIVEDDAFYDDVILLVTKPLSVSMWLDKTSSDYTLLVKVL